MFPSLHRLHNFFRPREYSTLVFRARRFNLIDVRFLRKTADDEERETFSKRSDLFLVTCCRRRLPIDHQIWRS